jgi:hypothetical protein
LPDGMYSNPKIPTWVNFGGSCNGRCWYSLWQLGPFYGHLVYLWQFGIFFPVWVYFTNKNLATLHSTTFFCSFLSRKPFEEKLDWLDWFSKPFLNVSYVLT